MNNFPLENMLQGAVASEIPISKSLTVVEQEPPSDIIEKLRDLYSEWASAAGSATKKLWAMLGQIYQSSDSFDSSKHFKATLVMAVENMRVAHGIKRWAPARKTAAELFLTLLLGFDKEHKVTKCQWLSALKRAKKQGVEASQNAFVAWLSANGGVNGSKRLKSINPVDPALDLEFIQQGLGTPEPNTTIIDIDCDDAGSEGDLVVVLARLIRGPSTSVNGLVALPLGVVNKRGIVKRAGEALLRAKHDERHLRYDSYKKAMKSSIAKNAMILAEQKKNKTARSFDGWT
ncbi:hypothetical protein [Sphingobium phenoxybenzoativorans]|uniref:hypothetical protein n=1 Tax=Sphingobium phenoxybenzoativorans TaxID=1592790 RepID=UPI000871E6C7|nr:hypothetical protein [Sphingobium phenoxybenzoativorans]